MEPDAGAEVQSQEAKQPAEADEADQGASPPCVIPLKRTAVEPL